MNETDAIKTRTKYFFDNQIKVHITFKDDRWKNGFITEITSADFFMLHEVFEGDQPVFFLQIKEIAPYIQREGKPSC
jgi:hypothetical protein